MSDKTEGQTVHRRPDGPLRFSQSVSTTGKSTGQCGKMMGFPRPGVHNAPKQTQDGW